MSRATTVYLSNFLLYRGFVLSGFRVRPTLPAIARSAKSFDRVAAELAVKGWKRDTSAGYCAVNEARGILGKVVPQTL